MQKAPSRTILICSFLIIIYIVPLSTLFIAKKSLSKTENRKLAGMPSLKLAVVQPVKFIFETEEYFKDHFAFREFFIRLNGLTKHKWLKASNSRVVIGRDDWLFMDRSNIISDFIGQSPFSHANLMQWKDVLESKQDWLESKGILYFFVIAPNKTTIYSEFLPESIIQSRGRSRREQLVEYLLKNSSINLIDTTTALYDGKKAGRTYYKEGSHWNGRGKFLAMNFLQEKMRSFFPMKQQFLLKDFEVIEKKNGHRHLVHDLGLKKWGKDPIYKFNLKSNIHWSLYNTIPEITKKCPADRQPMIAINNSSTDTVVIFHDSFLSTYYDTDSLLPLTSNFKRVVFIQSRADYRTLDTLIRHEKPIIVIEEYVERLLRPVPKNYLCRERDLAYSRRQ